MWTKRVGFRDHLAATRRTSRPLVQRMLKADGIHRIAHAAGIHSRSTVAGQNAHGTLRSVPGAERRGDDAYRNCERCTALVQINRSRRLKSDARFRITRRFVDFLVSATKSGWPSKADESDIRRRDVPPDFRRRYQLSRLDHRDDQGVDLRIRVSARQAPTHESGRRAGTGEHGPA